MAGRRRRLGRVIEDWAAKSHLSLTAVATRLGVKPDTFRGWVKNNRFPGELLPRLGQLMGVEREIDALERRFTFDLTDVRGPAAELRPITGGVAPTRPTPGLRVDEGALEAGVKGVLDQLSAGDLLAWVGLTDLPPELDVAHWPEVARALVGAVQRGVVLLYLHPGPRGSDPYDEPGNTDDTHENPHAPFWPHGPGFDAGDWSGPVRALRRNLEEELKQSGFPPEDAEQCVRLHVLEVSLGPTFFMHPHSLYGSIRHADAERRRYVHCGLVARAGSDARTLACLDDASAQALQRFVAHAVDVHLPDRREIAFRIAPPPRAVSATALRVGATLSS